ncbi:MAG: CHAT domain-containing protein [Prochloron sp. SP5CPC1]|nr:CHAT domain-containing protein [Candidatus Paraprochloron terpiosi SP5CPC1]
MEFVCLALSMIDLEIFGFCHNCCTTGKQYRRLSITKSGADAIAGTKALVMSLWRVPALPTVLLMEHFFAKLEAGVTVRTALTEAQNYLQKATRSELKESKLGQEALEERGKDKTDPPFSHPYYRGAWVYQ